MTKNKMNNTFVFVDESGTKKQDQFFLIGFLRIDSADKYFKTLNIYRDKLFSISKEERFKRILNLQTNNQLDEIIEFAKNPFKFELKYSKINNHNFNLYANFIKTLLSIGGHFSVIGIDRGDPNFKDTNYLKSSYKRIINTYLQKYLPDKDA